MMSSGRRFYEFQRYDFTIVRLTILRLADMIRANSRFKRRTSWNLKGISSKRRKKSLQHFAQWPFEHKGAKRRTWCMSGNCAKRILILKPFCAIMHYGCFSPNKKGLRTIGGSPHGTAVKRLFAGWCWLASENCAAMQVKIWYNFQHGSSL